ncbi:MAG: hypothetical protein ACREV6_17730 [Clostridium sp.]|uniref:hypothetical protein n=1 Tax=Clostridium sp. TaxID=1506 RepID=UPI003D6D7E1D
MRKKIICLSIIAGLLLSVGLGVSKKDIKFRNTTNQNIESYLLSEGGSTIIEPKVQKSNSKCLQF